MARTRRLFYKTSHPCQGQGEGSLFWGEKGLSWSSSVMEGVVGYGLLLGGFCVNHLFLVLSGIIIAHFLISLLCPISCSYLNL